MADGEEQYILRVQDKAVAARLKKQLNLENSKAKLNVRFDGALTSLLSILMVSCLQSALISC